MGPLVDMHDWGDMLVEAGFADPVMDQETVRLTYARPEQALAELRTLGANAHPMRQAGLRTPRWRDRLLRGLAAHPAPAGGAAETRPDNRVELTFELVYGHAFKPPPRLRVKAETRVDVQVLKDALRRPNEPGFR
jgi:malonyl-CoA O-methyltransferase